MEIPFENLQNSDLYVDAIYKGGLKKDYSAEPLHRLFPKCKINGGFRRVNRADNSGKPAYVILFTTMSELEWPDYLDEETGIFRYYGDNRKPGHSLLETSLKGNALLEETFERLNDGHDLEDIPPFFVFKKCPSGRDVQFLGLAVPGNKNISSDKDLVAFWRTIDERRFQNYEAYFTILDTKNKPIDKKWLDALIFDHAASLQYAPDAWKRYVKKGRMGIDALQAKRIIKVPSNYEQLQTDEQGNNCINIVRDHYLKEHKYPQGFEACAKELLEMMDKHFVDFSLTRPWRDGGRDAIGYYVIHQPCKANLELRVDCAMEAKCYKKTNSVGVREMSRLISRIKYRQFGVMITTSYIDKQAYSEIVEDGQPILPITATDIAAILRNNNITTANISDWLKAVDERDVR